ncbi:hypothetical protein Tco_0859450 [Tanacetum coccineum]|uniref:Uncharacterized protein n=1 Tax=Tanacetum coccineum TaxID=301880 RepID=A0ABQ5BFX9_9ASTR
MVHNHYLEETKKHTQEIGKNSKTSVMPSARSQSTANGSKPKPRINNQKSRNWPASKSSCVTTKTVPIAEHSRNSRNFSNSKHFICLTCQKCVFNANHDHCVTKFLNEVNSHAKVPSNKTMNINKPVEQTSFAKKPERQIPKGHRFSIKKTSVVHEKTMTPRFCLRWKPTGKIFMTIGLRWVPTGKIFTYSTTKVDSEPTNGSNEDITNQYKCKQTLDVSAGTLNLSAELGIHDHNNEPSSSKLVLKVVPPADKTATSRQEFEGVTKCLSLTNLFPYPAADFEANVIAEWNAVYDAHNEVACLMHRSMTPKLHRQFENYSPYEMLQELKSMFKKQAKVEWFDLIQTFHVCKQEEGKSVSSYILKMKGYVEQLERLGYVLP